MKIRFVFAAVLGLCTALQAAEDVKFTWILTNVEKSQQFWSAEPFRTGKTRKFSPSASAKWGPYIGITIPNVKVNTVYVLRAGFKAAKLPSYLFRHNDVKEVSSNSTAGKGVQTFFLITRDVKKNSWSINFDKKCGEVEITEFNIKEFSDAELNENILPEEALESGAWHSMWGRNGDKCFPVLKHETTSPEGKVLFFSTGKQGDGQIAGTQLPFLPNRKFELSFWVRGDEPGARWVQILGTNQRVCFGLKKEWSQVKLSGITPAVPGKFGMALMFLNYKAPVEAFVFGGADFHYLP